MSTRDQAETWPRSWKAGSRSARCPSCGASEGRPIMWGMPGPEVFEALAAGEIDIDLGGCCVEPQTHRCRSCGTSFTAGGRRR